MLLRESCSPHVCCCSLYNDHHMYVCVCVCISSLIGMQIREDAGKEDA